MRLPAAQLSMGLRALRETQRTAAEHRPLVLCGRSAPVEQVRAALLAAPGSDEGAAQLFAVRRLRAEDARRLGDAALVVYGGEVASGLDAATRQDLEVVGDADRPLLAILEGIDVPTGALLEAARVPGIAPGDLVPVKRGHFDEVAFLRRIAARAGDAGPSLGARLPALRPYVVEHLVEATARRGAAIAAAWFLPGADMPALAAIQLRLLLQIGAAHGHEISPERAVELASVLGAGLGMRAAARQALALVPGAGWVVKAGVAYAGTKALGRAADEYFSHGAPAALARLRAVAESARA